MTWSALPAGPARSGSIASMVPPRTATSARNERSAVTTVPPRTTRSVIEAEPSGLDLADRDRLGAVPQAAPPDLAEPVGPAVVGFDEREDVGRELADLRRRGAPAIWEEDLALADAAGVDRERAGR